VILDGPAVVVPAEMAGAVSAILDRWLTVERPAQPELLRLASELRWLAAQVADRGRGVDAELLVWVDVAEASRRLGVPDRTLRRRAARAQIPARRAEDGRRWLIGMAKLSNERSG
jgi:hypothetical protein